MLVSKDIELKNFTIWMRFNTVENSESIRINENQFSFSTTSCHETKFGTYIECSYVCMLVFFSWFIGRTPLLMKIECIEKLDSTTKSWTYQTNVPHILYLSYFSLRFITVQLLLLLLFCRWFSTFPFVVTLWWFIQHLHHLVFFFWVGFFPLNFKSKI